MPELPRATGQLRRQTKGEKEAMRAARREGQAKETLAVALRKRLTPLTLAPSPRAASKAIQDGPQQISEGCQCERGR